MPGARRARCARGRGLGAGARSARLAAAAATDGLPSLLLFDCDGVLVETEKDGHRVAFNEAFRKIGVPDAIVWDVDLYGELLEVGGGKERMKHDFSNRIAAGDTELEAFVSSKGGLDALAKELHAIKTDIMFDMVSANQMPPRPGIPRLIGEAAAANVRMAICSTSNEKAVRAVLKSVLESKPDVGISLDEIPIFAGDVVPRKKPDPAVYELAAQELLGSGWSDLTDTCVVVEDSRIGAQAAKSAGMRCIVTKSIYTESERFDDIQPTVNAIFDMVGDGSDSRFSMQDLALESAFWETNKVA